MTDFLATVPDLWMLLSIVRQHPRGLTCFQLANIAVQGPATTGVVNEVRNRMLAHREAGRVSASPNGAGGVVYRCKSEAL